MEKWVAWETETKVLYQAMRQELCAISEVAAALYLECLICDVDEELVWAQKKQIKFETLGYDIGAIIQCSDALQKIYK